MRSTTTAAFFGVISALVPFVSAATLCNQTLSCPQSAPCCSSSGYCDTKYCLGGCNPLYSFSETSCMPEPVCRDFSTDFNDLSRVHLNGTYNGNASAYDWTLDEGQITADPNGNGIRLLLTGSDTTTAPKGTKLSSTRYVHYGTINFELQATKWAGVVTAAITMSDVKDEIDWEWPGVETTEVQSNYFFLGYANYSATKGETHKDFSDTSSNFHTYTLDWQAETLQWIVDGNVIRTLQKSDTAVTLEDGTVQYQYPSTPSRIQISIWPAGTDANGEGTVTWAGGMIDWSDADFAANGYFHNTVRSISVSCADDAPAEIQGYTYAGNDTSMIPIVTFTNHSTIVGGASPTKGGVSFAGVLAVVALPSLLMLF